jgi:SAM-dependent methyltransferase
MTAEYATWSSTDFPYMCLKDRKRTEAFRDAIQKAVEPNDLVLELGAGTGILSFFAAAAGASHVVAVEIDPLLADALRRSAEANGFSGIVEVVEGDALTVPLPRGADVVIAEMIETALIDEMQVPALNRLHADGITTSDTTVIPSHYTTSAQLVSTSFDYYGITILAPKHLWPFYDDESWHPTETLPASDSVVVFEEDFAMGPLRTSVEENLHFARVPSGGANALRLHGTISLVGDICLGATNALNGDKVLPLDQPVFPDAHGGVALRVRWERGAGMHTFKAEVID